MKRLLVLMTGFMLLPNFAAAEETNEQRLVELQQILSYQQTEIDRLSGEIQKLSSVTGELRVNGIALVDAGGQWMGLNTGLIGPRGSTGPKGTKGPAGSKGTTGVVGDKGDRGPTGDRGDPGTPGAPGRKGPPGLQGPMNCH